MDSDAEARLLERQLAELRDRFNDQISPLVARLAELRRNNGSDRQLLIPRPPQPRAFKDKLPRQY